MKLLKKLAISTFAFAAFSFIACDNPSTPGVGEADSPDSPVVDAGGEAGGKTMKKFVVGITADYWKLETLTPQVHYYGESSGRIPDHADYWDDLNMILNTENEIWTWESEELESDGSETITVIIHSGDTKFLDESSGKATIKIGVPMLYTHAETFVEWDGSSGDTTVAVTKPSSSFTMPALPDAIKEADTVVAIDLSQTAKDTGKTNWNPSDENGMQIYAHGGNYAQSNPFNPWGGKEMTNVEGTKVWYYIFENGVDLPNNATFIIHDGTGENDNPDGDRITVTATITTGQKKILLNGILEDWANEE